jgi:hypothetical protein
MAETRQRLSGLAAWLGDDLQARVVAMKEPAIVCGGY